MKKKNIVKKLLSVIMSAATMFSLLTLPAHAIIPGEDAYGGQEDGYIRVDLEKKTTTFIPKTEIPQFDGTCTYDALNPADRSRLDTVNMTILNELSQNISGNGSNPAAVVDGEYYYVSPTYNQYSGVVLITTWRNNVLLKHGTGFLLDNRTVMTALHMLYEYADSNSSDEFDLSVILSDEIRVYYNVSEDLMRSSASETSAALLTFLNSDDAQYITMSNLVYSSAVNPPNNENDDNYDWLLGKLSTPLTGRYYWNCAIPTGTLQGKTSYVVGYPETHLLKMTETSGTVVAVVSDQSSLDRNKILYTNSNEDGLSGGPMYSEWGGVKCYGVHIGFSNNYAVAVKIYEDLFNVIVDYME